MGCAFKQTAPAYDHTVMSLYFVSLVDDLNRIPRQEMLKSIAEPDQNTINLGDGFK